ncbi:unnamed protein product [Urochloa humidicola]
MANFPCPPSDFKATPLSALVLLGHGGLNDIRGGRPHSGTTSTSSAASALGNLLPRLKTLHYSSPSSHQVDANEQPKSKEWLHARGLEKVDDDLENDRFLEHYSSNTYLGT